jgi:hypothetical protein
MRDKLNNLKNNQEFQEKLQEMKPKRNIWGILGVVLLFFVPEVVNVLWHKEITAWIMELIESAPVTPMSGALEWLTKQLFTGEVSYFNIGLGIALLVWIFWDDIKGMLK